MKNDLPAVRTVQPYAERIKITHMIKKVLPLKRMSCGFIVLCYKKHGLLLGSLQMLSQRGLILVIKNQEKLNLVIKDLTKYYTCHRCYVKIKIFRNIPDYNGFNGKK